MGKIEEVRLRKAEILAEKAERKDNEAVDAVEEALDKVTDEIIDEAANTAKADADEAAEDPEEATEEVAEDPEPAKPKIDIVAVFDPEKEPDDSKGFDRMSSEELADILAKAKEKRERAEKKLQEQTDRLKEASENIVSLEEKLEAKKKAEEEARIRAEEEVKRLAESKRKADAQAGAVVAGGESVFKHPADKEDDFEICDNGLWIPTSMRPAKCYKWWNYRKHEWTPTRNIHVAQASSDVWDVVFYWVNKGELVRPLNSVEIEKYVPDIYW